eukprot:GHVT01085611.1.p1 GENE.GHVT01085611.1~~GHVT01085611.1.p1  ORF type:complete len:214 (+),score=30.18 GHVT01085611.1:3150-3791(+)
MGLHNEYVPGYFKSAPVAYVRDAKVVAMMYEKYCPNIAQAISPYVPPEAYISKWFIGMNVHVLTFEALVLFFEALYQKGTIFLFQFAVALARCVETDLVEASRIPDVAKLFAILRLDSANYPNDKKWAGDPTKSFFVQIVEEAINTTFEGFNLEVMRENATEEMRIAADKRKEREAELGLESEDEIQFSDEDGESGEEDSEDDEGVKESEGDD